MNRPPRCLLLLLTTVLAGGPGLGSFGSSPAGAVGADDTRPRPAEAIDPAGPRIAVAGAFLDLGIVAPNAVVDSALSLTNAGSDTLIIKELSASCSCLEIGEHPGLLEPGAVGHITLKLHTVSASGAFTESLTLVSNDPAQPELTVELRGTVWQAVEAIPSFVMFRVTPDSPTNETAWVRIVNHTADPVDLKAPTVNSRSFSASLRPVVPGREYLLGIRAIPPLSTGHTFGKVTVPTSSPKTPQVEVTVMVPALPSVVATPTELRLPTASHDQPLRRTVWVRCTVPHRLQVTGVSVTPRQGTAIGGVPVRVTEKEPGRLFAVDLTFPPDFLASAGGEGLLVVTNNHPRHGQLRIPILPETVSPPAP